MGVLSCDETETLCRKNNLTFVELLQPFSKLMADVTLKDSEGVNHSVSNLNLLFQVRKKMCLNKQMKHAVKLLDRSNPSASTMDSMLEYHWQIGQK